MMNQFCLNIAQKYYDQQRAGVSRIIKFHDTRHTFASHYMMNGGSIIDLKELLGHSNLRETMGYTHLSKEHLQEATKFMGFSLSAKTY